MAVMTEEMKLEDKKVMTYSDDHVLSRATNWFNGDDMAAGVWLKKYALRTQSGELIECTPDDMFDRLAGELTRNESNPDEWRETFKKHLKGFKRLVLGGSIMAGLGNPRNISLSNCYVISSPHDSLKGIYDSVYRTAQIQAFRGGVGFDISTLRPDGGPVANAAGSSSGAWSWCDQFSYTSRKIGQRGRIGALMLNMRVDHPDIFKFIKMKSELSACTGANISVKITDNFMNAVENNDNIELWFNYDDNKYKDFRQTVKAREIWNTIIHYATTTAEPGVLMWDTIIRNSPADCYADLGFKTVSTNPCSEISACADDTCRLASINLSGFVRNAFTTDSKFDFDALSETISVGVRALDNVVDLDKLPFDEQKEKARLGRRIGLGTHGLADCLLKLGYKYDSDNTIMFVDLLYKFIKNKAYDASVNLAAEKGKFPIFDSKREEGHPFIEKLDSEVKEKMKKFGRRNIGLLTCAPTGSISVLSQCSSGIEPIYRLSYTRRIKITQGEDRTRADFVDKDGEAFKEHLVIHHAARDYLGINPDKNLNDLPETFITSDKIKWENRIKIQAAMQKHIDHSISSTINLPLGTTEDTVGKIYMSAWKSGLKGVTVYVEGSRSGVLVSNDRKREAQPIVKRTSELDGIAHVTKGNGHEYCIFLGMTSDKTIYEVFCLKQVDVGIMDGRVGKIVKTKEPDGNARYDFVSGALTIRCLNRYEDNEISAFTRMISTSLRYGIPLQEITRQLSESRGSITSVAKSINRVLSKYVETVKGERCSECGSTNTIRSEGCVKCLGCGCSRCS